jgi:hypothetical protein
MKAGHIEAMTSHHAGRKYNVDAPHWMRAGRGPMRGASKVTRTSPCAATSATPGRSNVYRWPASRTWSITLPSSVIHTQPRSIRIVVASPSVTVSVSPAVMAAVVTAPDRLVLVAVIPLGLMMPTS